MQLILISFVKIAYVISYTGTNISGIIFEDLEIYKQQHYSQFEVIKIMNQGIIETNVFRWLKI